MSKFTPGPWRIHMMSDTAAMIYQAGSCWPIVQSYVTCSSEARDANIANAALISAAPEMYEALGDCVSLLESLRKTDANSDGQIDEQIAAARAALAKAEGKV